MSSRETGVSGQDEADDDLSAQNLRPNTQNLTEPCPDIATMSPDEYRSRSHWAERDEARALLVSLSMAALVDHAEGLWWARDDPDWTELDRAVFALSRADHLAIAQAELDRRQRLLTMGHRLPEQFRRHSARLEVLCRAIHEQVHLGHVIEDVGMALVKRGKEFHSACIVCGGTDRFVIWPPPRSRGWCRQCGFSPDVISFWRSWEQTSFADAVLAVSQTYLGMGAELGEQ